MEFKKHGKILLNGLIVVTPLIITVYVVAKTVIWLDSSLGAVLKAVVGKTFPGVGLLAAIVGIYLAGLMARSVLFQWPLQMAEWFVERIPLVKSLYAATKDLLQFLGGADKGSRGKPCVIRSPDKAVQLLGVVTQENPQRFLPGDEERVAVYLPMSYQIGGYTLYVPRSYVTKIEGMSVEEMLKLCMTAGVGAAPAAGAPNEAREGQDETQRG